MQLHIFWFWVRVSESQRHIPTQTFTEYLPPSPWDWVKCMIPVCISLCQVCFSVSGSVSWVLNLLWIDQCTRSQTSDMGNFLADASQTLGQHIRWGKRSGEEDVGTRSEWETDSERSTATSMAKCMELPYLLKEVPPPIKRLPRLSATPE